MKLWFEMTPAGSTVDVAARERRHQVQRATQQMCRRVNVLPQVEQRRETLRISICGIFHVDINVAADDDDAAEQYC